MMDLIDDHEKRQNAPSHRLTRFAGRPPVINIMDEPPRAVPALSRAEQGAFSRAMAELMERLDAAGLQTAAEEDYLRVSVAGLGDPVEPTTLPVPSGKQIDAVHGMNIHLYPIRHLPGYIVSGIRQMGREVFRSMPCFQAFEEACRNKRCDALGEVFSLSTMTAEHPAEVDAVAEHIHQHGQRMAEGTMVHPMLPSYRPEVILYATEDWTFKLVRDRVENGAPINANHIYAWPGGLKFYRGKKLLTPA